MWSVDKKQSQKIFLQREYKRKYKEKILKNGDQLGIHWRLYSRCEEVLIETTENTIKAIQIRLLKRNNMNNMSKYVGKNLKHVEIFKNVGHGNECYIPCIEYIEERIKAHNKT